MTRPDIDDEDDLEQVLADCIEMVKEDPHRFTTWELHFIAELEDANDAFHLTDAQRDKLGQIHAERCQ
jgi:hypothetical protein